jgi:hypothetical protein
VLTGLELAEKEDETESEHIELWEYTFFTLNSSLNCLIFFYKNSALRRHAMNLLQKCVSSAKARTACLPLYSKQGRTGRDGVVDVGYQNGP